MNTQTQSQGHEVEVLTAPSTVKTKSNGSEYVMLSAKFIGKIDPQTNEELVAGVAFTIKNKDGKIKPVPAIGTKLNAYVSILINPETGAKKFLFELGFAYTETASDESLNALFGAEVTAGQTV